MELYISLQENVKLGTREAGNGPKDNLNEIHIEVS